MTSRAQPLLRGVRVAPSILSADFSRLGEQVAEVLDAGARIIHVDVMDGHFVPPITVGPLVVAGIAEQAHSAGAMLDVHLMIERPERHVADFVNAGADSVTVHAEATPHVAYAASVVRESGACVGVAINPGTPVEALGELASSIDLALCMTVNPGWGGQPFMAGSPRKVARLRAIVPTEVALEVDGGIDVDTARVCRESGASVFVAGSAIFESSEPGEAYRAIARSVDAE
jgi:ribulose-phosphate 3-epimerase